MDAVNSQSSNLLRIVHAGQGNFISEYLDSGPPYKFEKSQLPCKATGVIMLQNLFINILISVPYVMGSWLTTWSLVAKNWGAQQITSLPILLVHTATQFISLTFSRKHVPS
jgi:hypothetical protein